MVIGKPSDDFFRITDAVKLGAVAGRKDYRLRCRIASGKIADGFRQGGGGKRQLFPYA
ncbi:hypothetical protein NM3144_2145 [Neisseria meningitidis NM3144]|nr:hypothetical protein NM3144_2145 [Neisseria meningitidis NM3144]